MDGKIITLTLSEGDARIVRRAVKAREAHWAEARQINRHSNAVEIRKTYHGVAENITQQMTAQGVMF